MKSFIMLKRKDKKKLKCIEINYVGFNCIKKIQVFVTNANKKLNNRKLLKLLIDIKIKLLMIQKKKSCIYNK